MMDRASMKDNQSCFSFFFNFMELFPQLFLISLIPNSQLFPPVLQNQFHENGFFSASPLLSRKFNASHSGSHKVTTIKDLQTLQSSEKFVWYSLEATITNVNMDNFYFLACPLFVDRIQCMKKIAHKVGDIWHCDKCDGEFLIVTTDIY